MHTCTRLYLGALVGHAVLACVGCNSSSPLDPSSTLPIPENNHVRPEPVPTPPSTDTVATVPTDGQGLTQAQLNDSYSIDGTGNNQQHPDWGSAGVRLLRFSPAAYSNNISMPAGPDRPSPRLISNVISDQGEQDIISERLLSAMVYAWGQFIDHDLDLTPTGGTEIIQIPVPRGDPAFDPFNTGTQVIVTTRSIFDPSSGTDPTNPRQQVNVITAWLDGSMIYGSDSATAAKLRMLSGGRMKTSPGGLLPYNNALYLPDGPLNMANDSHIVPSDQLFAAGDVRANENIELTALHTLFVREHNFWAGQIAATNPSFIDEQVYQRARAIVIAEIQSITFNDWLPAILGPGAVPPYQSYNPAIDSGIANEFSAAAFRFGHSLLGDDVEFLDDNGLPIRDPVPLSAAFFNPPLLAASGIDPLLKYLASDPASELDDQVVTSVRNFLFGPPGAGGLDLASLNIARGRDHGLADYNSARQAYGLPTVSDFTQITQVVATQDKLRTLYGSVNNIDLWVGALAEGHLSGASVGPTLQALIGRQFARVRDGDRFWYQRRFSGPNLQRIEGRKLADIIRRNTQLRNIQPNVFFFQAGIAGTAFADVNGDGRPERGESGVPGVMVQLVNLSDQEIVASEVTDERGHYQFDVLDGIRTGNYVVKALAADGSLAVNSPPLAITRGMQFLDRVNLPLPPH